MATAFKRVRQKEFSFKTFIMLRNNLHSMALLILIPLMAWLSAQPFALLVGVEQDRQPNTIAELVEGTPQLSTFHKAVEAAGMKAELAEEGPVTVLLPTDDAFEKLPEGYMDELMEPENREQLRKVLNNHILEGEQKSIDLAKKDTVKTRVDELPVDASGKLIKVKNVNLIQTDVEASNGVLHVVDNVLIPSDM